MRAIIFDGTEATVRDDWPEPQPRDGEVLLAVRVAGVCRTDLEVLAGYMGFSGVMGHEFVGEVLNGTGADAGPSGRVVAEINCPCGACDMCRRGAPNHCRTRPVLGIDRHDGVFAERVVVPAGSVHAVPETVSDEAAVFVEPLAAAFRILEQVAVTGEMRVLVLGDGRLGQLIARVLSRRAGELMLVGRHAGKLALAGAHGITTARADAFESAADADVVVDATGTPQGFTTALAAVRPQGTLVLKSTFAAEGGLNLAPVVVDEVTVVGSRCGPFDRAIEALATGRIDPTDLVSARFALSEGVAALEAAGNRDNLKVLIDVA
ncbi:MAG: alcohol dehydrogenase catalytic domain-containing protein [Phycisphaerae bacterium]|nr:alcohol dehydrogenase catalytic domain-containing protein [Phycisphaerae bacterium]